MTHWAWTSTLWFYRIMALNPFFLQGSSSEQRLVQDLNKWAVKNLWYRSYLYSKKICK
jgi:hypothetical protein